MHVLVGAHIVVSYGIAVHGIDNTSEPARGGYVRPSRDGGEIRILPYTAGQKQFMYVLIGADVVRPNAVIVRVEKAGKRASCGYARTSVAAMRSASCQ